MRLLLIAALLSLPCVASGDDLLIFSASWCGPCRSLHAAIEKDPSLVDGYEVVTIDIDQHPELARMHGVKTVPTLIATGKTVRRKTGWHGVDDLRRWLQGIAKAPGRPVDARSAPNWTGVRFSARGLQAARRTLVMYEAAFHGNSASPACRPGRWPAVVASGSVAPTVEGCGVSSAEGHRCP